MIWYNQYMKITKFGHCCLLLEVDGARLLTDPGTLSSGKEAATGIDAIVITHEHADHFHIDSVRAILANNPSAIVITNAAVGALLGKENIAFTVVGDGQSTQVKGVKIEGFGHDHAPVYGPMTIENTGFMIAEKFFFPGDNFYDPKRPVDVLALPVAGPWMKISEAIDYAKALKPRVAFPVHDGMFVPEFAALVMRMSDMFLSPLGITFVALATGESAQM
jgi:L-ascorbate metabolism protein UlaG (beta-lactamase superfamily)